jgi:hypothetical protein
MRRGPVRGISLALGDVAMMRFGFSFLTLLYSFGLVTGCGNQNSRLELETGGLKAPAAVSAAQEIFADAKVTCSNPQRCPGYLAMLVILPDVPEPNELPSTCTGFLVEKDLLLTSAECLPASLQRAGASCRHKIQAFFPRTPQNQVERVGCSVVPTPFCDSISLSMLKSRRSLMMAFGTRAVIGLTEFTGFPKILFRQKFGRDPVEQYRTPWHCLRSAMMRLLR